MESVSVATANGFAGTVATPDTTPTITLTTNLSGLLRGNGTGMEDATWDVPAGGHLIPDADNAQDLGTAAKRPANIRAGTAIISYGTVYSLNGANPGAALQAADVLMASSGRIGFTTGTSALGTVDTAFTRDAAGRLGLKNGTSAQGVHVYNTDLGASGYERLLVDWLTNTARVMTAQSGSGVARNMRVGTVGAAILYLSTQDINRQQVDTSGHFGPVIDNAYDCGMAATRWANVRASQSMVVSSANASGLGYGTGAGGTVAQATSKATGVTLSKPVGSITMNAASLAANTTVSFVLTNTLIAATDQLVVTHVSGGALGSYNITAAPAAGSATIYVRNITAAALAEAIVLRFTLIKSVNA